MKKVRLDKLLTERELFPDESAALRAILAHEVKVGDCYATSAAQMVAPDVEVQSALESAGFKVTGTVESSIQGAKSHNVEYLVRAEYKSRATS